MAENKILEVKDLCCSYQKSVGLFGKKETRQVLQHVTFDIHSGEVLGLVGESGCGKTTLARAILGMLGGYSGQIIIIPGGAMIFMDPLQCVESDPGHCRLDFGGTTADLWKI